VTGQAASGGKTHTGYRYRMIWRDFRLTARVTLRRWFPSLLYFSDTLAQRAPLTASLQTPLRARAPHELPTQVIGW